MQKVVLGVVVGYVVWTALWLGGNALFFGETSKVVSAGETFSAVGPLVGLLALSIVCSLAAGMSAAALARARHRVVVLVTAGLLLATGIFVQLGIGSQMPVWYHLTFLVLIVPVCIVGDAMITR